MTSYRAQLARIGVDLKSPVSYRAFYTRPKSLRQAMRAMSFPSAFGLADEVFVDEDWTEEGQGVASDGTYWYFSSNGSAPEDIGGVDVGGESPKAIYTFRTGTGLHDDDVRHQLVIAEVRAFSTGPGGADRIPAPPWYQGISPYIHHVGALLFRNGQLFVDHWNFEGGQIIVFDVHDGALSFNRWIPLTGVGERVGFVGINPWDDHILTCSGNTNVGELYIHTPEGKYTGRKIPLSPPITDGGYGQGGFVSANGHIYLASGNEDIGGYQHIYCYSALNGQRLAAIPVRTADDKDELEGICYAPAVTKAGQPVHIHAVLLENHSVAKDNIFFKSFWAAEPDLI